MLCENVFLKMEGIAHVMGIVLEVAGGRRVGSTQDSKRNQARFEKPLDAKDY